MNCKILPPQHDFSASAPGECVRSVCHQENAESASTKLEVLGTMRVPYKRFEALPVLTANPKRVEARRITVEYFFLSLTCSAGTGFRQNGQRLCLEQALLHPMALYTKLERSASVHFHGLSILTEAHLWESGLVESLRIAWKRVEWAVVPLKRVGCTQLHKI